MIYDDIFELRQVESVFKKVGFDTLGITNEFSFTEKVLGFNPDLIIVNGKGIKVSTIGVAKRLKEMHRWQGKVILIFPSDDKPDPDDLIKARMDLILDAPVDTARLIQVTARLTHQDEKLLIEKLQKYAQENPEEVSEIFVTGNTQNEVTYVSGGVEAEESSIIYNPLTLEEKLQNANATLAEKMNRYKQMTQGIQTKSESTLTRIETKKAFKELVKDWDQEELKSQDELRRKFTQALFKKK